jgi:hypothetical protein
MENVGKITYKDDLWFYTCCVQFLVYVDDYSPSAWKEYY